MKTVLKRIQTLDVTLPAEAGALARIYSGFREANVNVIASWGYEMGPKEAMAHFFVADTKATEVILKKMGLKAKVNDACWIEGDDKLGAYAEVLGRVSKAGVNLTATDAFSINGRFASVLFTAPNDFPKLCKALEI